MAKMAKKGLKKGLKTGIHGWVGTHPPVHPPVPTSKSEVIVFLKEMHFLFSGQNGSKNGSKSEVLSTLLTLFVKFW